MIALWPVLDTHYGGLPPTHARLATLVGLAISYGSYALALVLLHRLMLEPHTVANGRKTGDTNAPLSGRRSLLVGSLSVLVFGFVANWLIRRKLFDLATFQYDGLQYLGPDVQPITPNDRFYTVTKNVIDPRVNKSLWQLEVTGLVERPQTFRFEDLTALPAVTQETTLMCISYSVGGGLMSNARWRGVPMRRLIEAAQPKPGVVEVLLHAADGYTDTFALEKAMDETTLVVYEMNGEPLPIGTAIRYASSCRACSGKKTSNGSRASNSLTTTPKASTSSKGGGRNSRRTHTRGSTGRTWLNR